MTDFPHLETERVLLREMVAADAPALLAIHGDQDAMRWYGAEPLMTMEQAVALIGAFAAWRQLPNPGVRWGIERKADQHLIGSCGLFKWNRSWRSCVIGYELATTAQGQGFMIEALSEALAWGFEHMDLNRIEAQVHANNALSIRLLAKLGFVREGCMREAGFWHGQHHDLQQFSLLRRDYVVHRPQARSL